MSNETCSWLEVAADCEAASGRDILTMAKRAPVSQPAANIKAKVKAIRSQVEMIQERLGQRLVFGQQILGTEHLRPWGRYGWSASSADRSW